MAMYHEDSERFIKSIRVDGVDYEIEDETARASIGDMDSLCTTEKGSLVGAINELANLCAENCASFDTDASLTLQGGILSVNTTDQMEQDNTLPITSAGVYAVVGNIEALLNTI